MNQTLSIISKELRLEKITIVKLNTAKVGQLAQAGITTSQQTLTTASTAPDCDMTTVSTTGII